MMENLKACCMEYCASEKEMSFDNRYLFEKLIDKSLDHKSFFETNSIHRKSSISVHGAPIVFSLKYDRQKEKDGRAWQDNCRQQNVQRESNMPQHGRHKGIRLLAEPGGYFITIPQQIDFCLQLLNEVVADLRWDLASDVNQLVSIIYPRDGFSTMNWRGGMWLGLETSEKQPMLKLYMNLRHQTQLDRWQKIADVIVKYSKPEMENIIRFIISSTQIDASPIGIGAAVGKNGIMGLRIYLSFQTPKQAVWDTIYKRFAPKSLADVTQMISFYQEIFSHLPQSVLTFDFVIGKDRLLLPEPVRLKTELSSCHLEGVQQEMFEQFIKEQISRFGFPRAEFEEDLSRMKGLFGNIFYQYASYGSSTSFVRDRTKEQFTVYYEPAGLSIYSDVQ